MQQTKPIRIFQYLPGEKVKVTVPNTQFSKTMTKDVFEEFREQYSDVVYFLEQINGDTGFHFKGDDGFVFTLGRQRP